LHWLDATNGLGAGAFWFSFEDIHSGGYIIDTLTGALLGTQAMALPLEQKLTLVTKKLREHPFRIVWDNFESASGIPGTEVSALLSGADRQLLKQFLAGLLGGQTKIIITSRAPEKWLTDQECYRLPLAGLQGEELWQYCDAVVSDLKLALDRQNEDYRALLDRLEGKPLAVRVILLRLTERPAKALLTELDENFQVRYGDQGRERIQATLAIFEKGLDRAFEPVLRLLWLNEHYADAGLISAMLKQTGETAPIAECFSALKSAGLCLAVGNNFHQIHPALRNLLIRPHQVRKEEQRAFVDMMDDLADAYAPKELHEQRLPITGLL